MTEEVAEFVRDLVLEGVGVEGLEGLEALVVAEGVVDMDPVPVFVPAMLLVEVREEDDV